MSSIDLKQGVNSLVEVKINGESIPSGNVIFLVIRTWIFDVVPRLELLLNDDGLLSEVKPLTDHDLIEVSLAKNYFTKNKIKMTFRLMSYEMGSMKGNKYNQYQMYGMLDVGELYYPIQTRSFPNLNSYQAISDIITECGSVLNKDTNINPVDTMTWLQSNCTNLEMVKHVMKRAYINDDAIFVYADETGEFTYNSLKNALSKNVKGEARYDLEKFSAEIFKDVADYQDIWLNTYCIHSYNGHTNIYRNYGVNFNSYDLKAGASLTEYRHQKMSNAPDSTKDESEMGSGRSTYNFDYGYKSTNTHSNYYQAMTQNDYLKHAFFSGNILELNINSLSDVKLLDKINVSIPSLIGITNKALSGDYLVSGIVFEYQKGETLRKNIHVSRDGQGGALIK